MSSTLTPSTPVAAHKHLKESFATQPTQSIEFRQSQLRAVRRFLQETEEEHVKSLHSDLGKSRLECLLLDIHPVTQDIDLFLKNLHKLSKPQSLSRLYGSQAYIQNVPKGTMLIFGPFNFPTLLVLRPLVAAIAAGNVCCIKPSELTPASERYLLQLVKYVDPRILKVVTGGKEVCDDLLKLKWDHIMFTGSPMVGKIVMKAASNFLTPVTLELGGKCPAIITASADIPTTVASIVRARFYNCGQICLAADYCMVHESKYEEFIKELTKTITEFFTTDPISCAQYGRPVSERHYQRLVTLLTKSSGQVLLGGLPTESQRRTDSLFIPPTVIAIDSLKEDDALIKEEIFGPILPVIRIEDTKEAIEHINAGEEPLTLYAFSNDTKENEMILQTTRSGSVGINETILQVAVPGSHLGGVGESGMGAYGGVRGFEEFSHQRPVMYSTPFWSRFISIINPNVLRQEPWWLEKGIRMVGKIPERIYTPSTEEKST